MKNSKRDIRRGIFFLLLAAFLYSIMPVMIRFLGNNGIPPVSQVFLRYIFAFFAAFIYYFFVAKVTFSFPKKHIALLLFATLFGYGLTNLFFTIGILNTQVSNALFLFYSFAIIAPILGYLFLRDKLNIFNNISLLLTLIALLLLFRPTSSGTWAIGGLFALLSAICQALYMVLRKKLSDYSATFMMLANTCMGILLLGVLSLLFDHAFYFQGSITHVSINTWVTTILFGLDNFFGWLAVTKGFEYFRATSASVILLAELIFAIFFAFIFFKEIPTIATLIGGLLILISSVVVIYKGES